ncbi:TetR/AcrR family transcriptional regulator [Elongatibacter sediminis]|uniref:TetR/AcrR family transcriptional regulator n=1 Tax=Elongatibacter sediminis TaxID=3119006 RepID=A0AAW9R979_9GAMM
MGGANNKQRSVQARKRPVQKRSENSLERILAVSAEILEQAGVEGFNTNEISKRSGVAIGSVYHYFPNKEAILFALCSRWLDSITAKYESFEELGLDGEDPRAFWRALIDRLFEGYRMTRGLRAITQATEMWPQIKELDVRFDEKVILRIGFYLRLLGIKASQREQKRLSTLILNMLHYGLLLSVSMSSGEADKNLDDITENLVSMVERHRPT